MAHRKVTVDGMSACGKSSLITALTKYAAAHYEGKLKAPEPSIGLPSPITSIEMQNPETRSIDCWEVSYSVDRLVILAYPKTNLVLFCFALDHLNDLGYEDFVEWKLEGLLSNDSRKSNDVPLILVGCRNEIRQQVVDARTQKAIDTGSAQLKKFVKRHGLDGYFECSAESGEGVPELFEAILARIFFEDQGSAPNNRRAKLTTCALM